MRRWDMPNYIILFQYRYAALECSSWAAAELRVCRFDGDWSTGSDFQFTTRDVGGGRNRAEDRRTDVFQAINRRCGNADESFRVSSGRVFVPCVRRHGLRVSEWNVRAYTSQAYTTCVFLHSKNFHRAKSFFPPFSILKHVSLPLN